MRVAIIATHAHPLPSKAFTGDSQVILDLCVALGELGHEVTLFAPKATTIDVGVQVVELEQGEHFEAEAVAVISKSSATDLPDVFHDFSIGKAVHRHCLAHGFPSVSTLLGGTAYTPLANTVVWTDAMRNRVTRGDTDWTGTAHPEYGGHHCQPFSDVKTVHGGVDLNFYSPGEYKSEWCLWLSRWHEAKGYRQAIEWAMSTGDMLLMAGVHPDDDHPAQAAWAREAVALASGIPNITFEWLPPGAHHHTVKRDLLRRARAFIAPLQFHEPFGLGLIEALACGIPVLTLGSQLGSIPELVGDGDYDPRKRAEAMFGRDRMARNYVDLYQTAIDGKGWGA